jgi:DNA-binding PadR family transcriptional regulator
VTTRLLVLWLLSEGPHHGYGLRRILHEDGLRFWFRPEDASIQSMLRTLASEGHARVVRVERTGERVRTVYGITRAGREHLRDLLRRAWSEPPASGDALQVALAARSDVDEGGPLAGLRAREAALRARIDEAKRLRRAAPAPEMVERELARLRAELAWTRRQAARESRRTR